MNRRIYLALAVTIISSTGAAAAPNDAAMCQAAMTATERGLLLPARLLEAIGSVESGRLGARRMASSWPWTSNIAGVGHFYDTKADAIAAVASAQRAGVRSIDVGCMQINLQYHPDAFASLDDAFDPATNVRYGAVFLQRLRAETGNWPDAIAGYHSFTPERGAAYSQRVAAVWPQAASYAVMVRSSSIVAAGMSAPVREPSVDPYRVATPEFRAKLVEEAAFRRARDAAMGLGRPATRLAAPFRAAVFADAGGRPGQAGLHRHSASAGRG